MSESSRVRFRLFVSWNVHTVVFLPIFVFWLFCSVDVVYIVSCRCNQSFSVLFLCNLRVFVSMLSSMLVSPLPSFDTYSVSMLSLGCKGLYIVISFLVLGSICLRSSLISFKNGPSILQGELPRLLSLG